ncbi:hypothetical protein T4B_6482 [Trichinella pseudospiralis]|uniref:Uncharacterized protein n=1 Tax=Trichinella pseudospiralis TaxID=6337 RepID=A0A0V1JJ82_TRIPS|nr:hypothetical protein T4B_6482 [Trichinella pseudospiralis]
MECVPASTYIKLDKENDLWASYATLRLKFHGTVSQSQHGLFYIPLPNGPTSAAHCESSTHKMEIHHGTSSMECRMLGTDRADCEGIVEESVRIAGSLMKKTKLKTRSMELQTPIH